MSNRRGFTLIEFMIAVLVIGILAAIVVPNFVTMQNRAKERATTPSDTTDVPGVANMVPNFDTKWVSAADSMLWNQFQSWKATEADLYRRFPERRTMFEPAARDSFWTQLRASQHRLGIAMYCYPGDLPRWIHTARWRQYRETGSHAQMARYLIGEFENSLKHRDRAILRTIVLRASGGVERLSSPDSITRSQAWEYWQETLSYQQGFSAEEYHMMGLSWSQVESLSMYATTNRYGPLKRWGPHRPHLAQAQ